MDKVLIYGAGNTGKKVYEIIKGKCDIIGFLDGDVEKHGQYIDSVKIYGGVEMLHILEYEKIYIGSFLYEDIKELLIKNGVDPKDIIIELPNEVISPVRNAFLKDYCKQYMNTKYSVAEGGVYRGDFAAIINKCFPNSKLYLFDTFEGFDERDIEVDKKLGFSNSTKDAFENTSIELVMSKMVFPNNVVIRKGYFPETITGINDMFCFVNLDFDLYQPILEGLRFFYPRMIYGSVILVHDYFHIGLPGVKKAIDDFETECKHELIRIPIGDEQSIAIIKG